MHSGRPMQISSAGSARTPCPAQGVVTLVFVAVLAEFNRVNSLSLNNPPDKAVTVTLLF